MPSLFAVTSDVLQVAFKAVIACCCLAITSSCTSPEFERSGLSPGDYTNVVDYGQKLIEHLMKKNDVPGVSIVLVSRDKVLWAQGFGWASRDNREPMTAETPMRLASITKVFTAVSIMQLVDRGIVDLDSPLKQYLPNYGIQSRFSPADVTVRQILTHHAGLPSDMMQGFKLYTGEGSAPVDLLEQFRSLPVASHSLHLKAPPGKVFSYSNLGFALLGSVIEGASGEMYQDYVRRNILLPLGMADSTVVVPGDALGIHYSNGFTPEGEINHRYVRDISAGAMAASANDMGRFLRLLLNQHPTLITENSLDAMLAPQNDGVILDGDLPFGLSLFLSPRGMKPLVASHAGDSPPYHASLRFMPNEGLGVVVMTNSSAGQLLVNQVSQRVLDAAYQANRPGSSRRLSEDQAAESWMSLSESQGKAYSGLYYFGPSIGMVRISVAGRHLTANFLQTGLADARLDPVASDTFHIKLRLFGFIPLPLNLVTPGQDIPDFELKFELIDGEQHVWLVADGVRGNFPLGIPLGSKTIPDSWMRRLGKYVVIDSSQTLIQSADLTFDKKSGHLHFRVANDLFPPINLAVKALSDSQLATLGYGRFGGEIIDALDGDTLLYAGVTLERLRDNY